MTLLFRPKKPPQNRNASCLRTGRHCPSGKQERAQTKHQAAEVKIYNPRDDAHRHTPSRVPTPLPFKDSRRYGGTAHPGPVGLQSRAEDQRPEPRAVTGPNGPLWSPAPLGAARTLPAAHGGERPPRGAPHGRHLLKRGSSGSPRREELQLPACPEPRTARRER